MERIPPGDRLDKHPAGQAEARVAAKCASN